MWPSCPSCEQKTFLGLLVLAADGPPGAQSPRHLPPPLTVHSYSSLQIPSLFHPLTHWWKAWALSVTDASFSVPDGYFFPKHSKKSIGLHKTSSENYTGYKAWLSEQETKMQADFGIRCWFEFFSQTLKRGTVTQFEKWRKICLFFQDRFISRS